MVSEDRQLVSQETLVDQLGNPGVACHLGPEAKDSCIRREIHPLTVLQLASGTGNSQTCKHFCFLFPSIFENFQPKQRKENVCVRLKPKWIQTDGSQKRLSSLGYFLALTKPYAEFQVAPAAVFPESG
jgi:hypothetical protein